jgi:hypothetical protein
MISIISALAFFSVRSTAAAVVPGADILVRENYSLLKGFA